MKCANCGREFDFGKFCPSCGTPAPDASNPQNSLGNFDEQPVFTGSYSYTAPEAEEPKPVEPKPTYHAPIAPAAPVKRKPSRGLLAAVLAIVLIAGAVLGVLALGSNGPADKIGKGAMKVLNSKTFNIDITVSQGSNSATVSGTVEFNPKESILNYYIEAVNKATDEKVITGAYDGQVFTINQYEDGDKWYSYGEMDEDGMEEFFEYYLEYSDSDLNKKKDVLLILEEIDDLSDGELSDIADLEVLAECITEYVGAHNDKKWLEENAGFSQEKKDGTTYYTYEPNLYEFCEVSLPFFEEAFEDDDIYDEGMDAIKDSRSDLKAINLEITFGVKSGYLTEILMDVEGVEIEVIFSEFGKAELDYDELEDLASECEEGYEEQWNDYYGYYD